MNHVICSTQPTCLIIPEITRIPGTDTRTPLAVGQFIRPCCGVGWGQAEAGALTSSTTSNTVSCGGSVTPPGMPCCKRGIRVESRKVSQLSFVSCTATRDNHDLLQALRRRERHDQEVIRDHRRQMLSGRGVSLDQVEGDEGACQDHRSRGGRMKAHQIDGRH